jgi:diguanylate cyclase (GGDEF)-like protein
LLVSNFQKSISEKVKEQTDLLLKNQQQLKYVLDATGDGIWDWNILTGHVSHNQRWLEILRIHTGETSSSLESFKNRIYSEDLPRVLEAIKASFQNDTKYSLEYRMIAEDQSLVWVSDVGVVVERSSNGDPIRMVGAISDISKQKESQSKIEELVFFDPVTNLPNRRYVKDRIERSINEAARVDSFSGLMLLDLDNFKLVNDTHGHNIGDVLLQKFGARLIEILRPMDVVARIGGDEFLVLFERNHSSEEECRMVLERVLERLCAELEEAFDLGGDIKVTITPSIGVVIYSQKSKGFDEVLKFADLAMYKNKINPVEKYRFFDQSLHDEFLEMSEMAGGLIKACEADQFYVEYQPVLDRNKEVIAFEALARWDHPDLGTVMPGKFIPFAEKNGQIRLVANAIFKKIFSSPKVAQLKEGKKPIRLMINLSGTHLMDIKFADEFTAMVKGYNFPLNLIDLEVTEGVFLEDKRSPIKVMQTLNDLGIKFALDDFGTGYSSFSYLQKLPIHFLKIDKSFVDDVASFSTGGSIVENIIALAHALNLKVIAEGVETEEQFNTLLALGCDYFQGWCCGRPGPLPLLQV